MYVCSPQLPSAWIDHFLPNGGTYNYPLIVMLIRPTGLAVVEIFFWNVPLAARLIRLMSIKTKEYEMWSPLWKRPAFHTMFTVFQVTALLVNHRSGDESRSAARLVPGILSLCIVILIPQWWQEEKVKRPLFASGSSETNVRKVYVIR